MSFGFAIGDFIILSQLASRVVKGARDACGAHDELTREVSSLHIVLRALEREVEKPNSILNSEDDDRKNELQHLVENCDKALTVLERILQKYNGLSDEQRAITNSYKKVKFGSGEMVELSKLRLELATHTNVITMFLNLLSVGSLGKLETLMNSNKEDMKGLRESVNWITGSLQAQGGHGEGSILTSYTSDDKSFWKDLRRELVKDGYSSRIIRKHKSAIQEYVKELGSRGALDALPERFDTTAITEGEVPPLDEAHSSIPVGFTEDSISEASNNQRSQLQTGLRIFSSPGKQGEIQVLDEEQPTLATNLESPSSMESDGENHIIKTEHMTIRPIDEGLSHAKATHSQSQPELHIEASSSPVVGRSPSIASDFPSRMRRVMLPDAPYKRSPNKAPANVSRFPHQIAESYIREARRGRFLEQEAICYTSAGEVEIKQNFSNRSRWDTRFHGLQILGNVFDYHSFGQWVFDWIHYNNGLSSSLTRKWVRIWIVLSKLTTAHFCHDCTTIGREHVPRKVRGWINMVSLLLDQFCNTLGTSGEVSLRPLDDESYRNSTDVSRFVEEFTRALSVKWLSEAIEWSSRFENNFDLLVRSNDEVYKRLQFGWP